MTNDEAQRELFSAQARLCDAQATLANAQAALAELEHEKATSDCWSLKKVNQLVRHIADEVTRGMSDRQRLDRNEIRFRISNAVKGILSEESREG